MANEDLKLNVILKVNKDTGQLEIAKQEMAGVEDAAKKAGDKSGELLGNLKSLLPVFSALAAIKFLSDAVKEAEAENEALRRLKFQLEASGESWDKNQQAIQKWATAIQSSTRFADEQAYEALGKLTRVTGNLTESQRLSSLAFDISASTGKDLNETIEQLGLAYQNNSRGITQLRKEFGAQVGELQEGGAILNKLADIYGGAAEKEESFTKVTADAKSQLSELKESIGNQLIPALIDMLKFTKEAGNFLKPFITGITAVISTMITGLTTAGKIIVDVLSGNWKKILTDSQTGNDRLVQIWTDASNKIVEQTNKSQNKINEIHDKGHKFKAQKSSEQTEKEKDLLAKHYDSLAKQAEDNLKLGLDKENITYQQRLELINTYESAIIEIIKEKFAQHIITAQQANDAISGLYLQVAQSKQDAAQKEADIEREKSSILATIQKGDLATEIKTIDDKAKLYKQKGINEVIVDKWAKNEKAKATIESAKQIIDIESVTGNVIDGLASADATKRKTLVYDILSAEATAQAKKLALMAIVYAVSMNWAMAAAATAGAIALTAAAQQINIKKQQILEEDRLEKTKQDERARQEERQKDERKKQLEELNKETETTISGKKEVSTFSERSEVTRTEQVVRIDVGGIEINIDNVTTDQIDIDKVMRDIGYKVQAKTLEAIQMAMRIYNEGKANEGLA